MAALLDDDAPTLEPLADGTGHRVRVRFGKQRRRIRIPTIDLDLAAKRAAVLVELGAQLGNVPAELARDLLERAGAADSVELKRIKAAVEKLASGVVRVRHKTENPRHLWTVRELGEAWTEGKLAKDFPDQIKARRAVGNDISRLDRHVYPVIGDVRVRDLALADVERVMASLTGKRPTQAKLSALTRRTIALTLNRLLNLAVYPLKIRTSNPIPKGLAPKAGKRRAMAYLYPDEDRSLLACKAVPLRERLLWGFLVREGCRVSEALGLRWSDVDLKRGAVKLDRNKTDDPRAWALAPGVTAALAHFEGEPGALVFDPPTDPLSLAEVLRARLLLAGVRRPELHKQSAERIALRVHDLRGSFVTVALANGRSESWVSDRTGHRSSQMLARYKRAARTAEELGLGDWTPLDVALGLVKPPTPAAGPKRGGRQPTPRRRATARDSKRDSSALPIRFERTTLALGKPCSIQLSYGSLRGGGTCHVRRGGSSRNKS
jgi:integrase